MRNVIILSLLPVFCAFAANAADVAPAKTPDEKCLKVDVEEQSKLLFDYSKKSGNDPDSYSVVGIGNHEFLFDGTLTPMFPAELAGIIGKDPKSQTAKQIVLSWPFSTLGNGSFKKELAALVKKPVVGFSGPLWWYPDGTAISNHPDQTNPAGPDESNVAECLTADGKYHEEAECKAVVKAHKGIKPIFGNVRFVLSCDQVQKNVALADKEDPEANLRLYFYNFFVNVDADKAALYLSHAAIAGSPMANYLTAHIMLNENPPQLDYYKQFLKRAADGGMQKAKDELANAH